MTDAGAKGAAFFDLDKTIIATTSSGAFSGPLYRGGLVTRSRALKAALAQFLFLVGSADENQTTRLRDALSELVIGWSVEDVRRIVAETVHESVDPIVYREALGLIQRHKANGRDVIIVSASPRDLVQPIADALGATGVIASELEVVDGLYTGAVTFYCFGEAKAQAVRDLAAERGIALDHSYAYSDSITDVPMLSAVQHGFAVNPDRELTDEAIDHGWGILRFRTPVALRAGKVVRSTAATLGAVALGFVVGMLIWRAARRSSAE